MFLLHLRYLFNTALLHLLHTAVAVPPAIFTAAAAAAVSADVLEYSRTTGSAADHFGNEIDG